MWTANLDSFKRVGPDIVTSVTYTDGNTNITETPAFSSAAQFKQTVINKINQLTQADADAAGLTVGLVDTTVPAIVPTPAPTQAQLDATQWLSDYARWVNIKTKLIDTGILTGSETAVTTFKTKVQTNFKPTYLALI